LAKGKCFSMVDQGQRRDEDAYPTPYSLTKLFMEETHFGEGHVIWEPACGENRAMSDEIQRNIQKGQLFATDKFCEGYDYVSKFSTAPLDFLECADVIRTENLITNPPYSLFKEFILKAKKVTASKIAMLLPLSYLQGQDRYDYLWNDKVFPLQSIYVFNRFPDLRSPLRVDGKFRTGMAVYAWFVWNKYPPAFYMPTIKWLDCREYVLRKGDKVQQFSKEALDYNF
jgi:hypothetical protein